MGLIFIWKALIINTEPGRYSLNLLYQRSLSLRDSLSEGLVPGGTRHLKDSEFMQSLMFFLIDGVILIVTSDMHECLNRVSPCKQQKPQTFY